MDFGLSDVQRELKTSARDFLKNEAPTSLVRQLMAQEDGMPRELHRKMAELGWMGLIVPENFGGLGLGMLDMAVLLEEAGYAALPGPLLFSSALSASALRLGGSDAAKEKWLTRIASGDAIGTIAIVEHDDSLNPADLKTTARRSGASYVLNGTKLFVPYAHCADFIVVAAKVEPAADPNGVALFLVERAADGVEVRMLKSVDQTRRFGELKLGSVTVSADARLDSDGELFEKVLDIGAVAMSADSLGGTERVLEMAVEYSKVREQFGKPIGSFQALKHAAAEIVADLEPARALLWYAAYALDELPKEASRASSMAKARLSDVFSRASDRAVLMHGGIGFTWEHDIHLWFKRARLNDSFFGDAIFHRERVAKLSGY
jgi:alkylation response protein AidB-like acyl-CoA dehydrogenase